MNAPRFGQSIVRDWRVIANGLAAKKSNDCEEIKWLDASNCILGLLRVLPGSTGTSKPSTGCFHTVKVS